MSDNEEIQDGGALNLRILKKIEKLVWFRVLLFLFNLCW